MYNGGEGRTLKPCCDAALASSRYISSAGPAKAHSLAASLPSLLLLCPSASGSLRPSRPLPLRRARFHSLPPSRVDDSCPQSPPSTFLGPKSPCGGDAWAGGGIREALYKSPGYRLTRAHSFSPFLSPPLPCLPSSLSLPTLPFFHPSFSSSSASSVSLSFTSIPVPPDREPAYYLSHLSRLLSPSCACSIEAVSLQWPLSFSTLRPFCIIHGVCRSLRPTIRASSYLGPGSLVPLPSRVRTCVCVRVPPPSKASRALSCPFSSVPFSPVANNTHLDPRARTRTTR